MARILTEESLPVLGWKVCGVDVDAQGARDEGERVALAESRAKVVVVLLHL